MRQLNKNLLRVLYILLLSVLLALPMLAADAAPKQELRVLPVGEDSEQYQNIVTGRAQLEDKELTEPEDGSVSAQTRQEETKTIPTFSSGETVLNLIKNYEGFAPKRIWDYERWSIGYGSAYDKALEMFPEIKPEGVSDDDVVLSEAQGEAILMDDLRLIEDFLNGVITRYEIVLNQNQFDALVDFTYNVGSGWWTYRNDDGSYCLLRQMLEDDPSTWTEERAQTAFGTWRTAGGEVLPGLVERRAIEAALFMTPVDELFSDVSSGAWFYDYVITAYELGLMEGYPGGTFGPDDSLTRAQMVQTLANLVGVDLTQYEGQNGGFTDVDPDAWFAAPIAWASELRLVNGRGDGTFDPDEPISRQHLCSIMARYLRSLGIEPDASAELFADDAQMDETSRQDVYYCASLGLVEGMGENTFAPQGTATRGQVAKILVGMYALIAESTEAA